MRLQPFSLLPLSLFLLFASLLPAPAQFLGTPPKAVPSLVADTEAIAPGKPFTLGIRFVLADRWHLYWRFPGDSGAAPQVEWELPEGFTAGPIQWPLPHSLKAEGDLFTNVYEGEVLFPVEILPPAKLPAGPLVFKGRLKWYVCSETCLPGSGEVTLDLAAGTPKPANKPLFDLWKGRLPQNSAPPFSVDWSTGDKGLLVRVQGAPAGEKLEIFPIPPEGANAEHPESVSQTFRIPTAQGTTMQGWKALVVVENGTGTRRGWQLEATSSPGATLQAPIAGQAPRNPQPQPAEPKGGGSPSPLAPEGGLAGVLWAAFLGGLLLNLMPCVLPVIALKIFGFTQQAGEEPKRVFRLGLAFVAGVFVFFAGLAAAVVGLKSAGSGLNWGFQFQNPYILTGLIAAVFVFGLNLLGVFEITLGSGATSKLDELSSRQGYLGAFLHGAFTTLLGTSCTAPYLGVTLGFAMSQPAPSVFLIFLTIAAGMSLPYLLLTSNPALLRFLPKPGLWMERLKQVMGFIILGVAVWLLSVLGDAQGVAASSAASFFLLILGVACWLLGTMRARGLALCIALALAAGGYMALLRKPLASGPGSAQGEAALPGDFWEPFSPERVAAARAAGKPVFIDFTAKWCINCKFNEQVTLARPEVRDAFKAHGVVMLKADWTHEDPVITAELRRFKRAGVPFYLLYSPQAAEPHIFPELLTPALVLEALNALPKP